MNYLRLFLVLLIAGAIVSCRGGGSGPLPPVGSRHRLATGTATIAQWNSGSQYNPTALTVGLPVAPAVGDVLLVALWNNGQTTGAANTYTAPAGWTLVDQNRSQSYATYQIFAHVVASGETNTYVFTPLAAQRNHVWIVADISGASGVDQSGNTFINNGISYATPTLTSSQAGDLAVAFNLPMTTSVPTWTNPPGWTVGTGPTTVWRGEALYQSVPLASSISESATLSLSASGFSALVLLAPSTGVPTASPTPTQSPTATPVPTPTAGGGNAPTPTQWTSGAAYNPSSITVSWPISPASGHTLVVAFWNNGQSTGSANTYTAPTGWSMLAQDTSHNYATYQAFTHVVVAGEANSYVFTPQAAQREQNWIAVDVANASGVDKAVDVFVSNATLYSSPIVVPAQSGDLAIALNLPMILSSPTWSNPASWTLGTGPTPTWRGEALYQALASPASISETSTLSAPASGFSGIVLLAPSSAQPTPPPTPTPTPTSLPPGFDWSTMGYDNMRTGFNPNERTIGTGSFGTMHSIWTTNVGFFLLGEPSVALNVNVGGTNHNVLYAGGISGLFYAVDADTGGVIWTRQLGSGSYVCPGSTTSSGFGIEGAAALDRARNRIYVPDGLNKVHALDLSTGAEANGWPASIANSTGRDFIFAGITYNPNYNNGTVYAETSSTCDISPWYGRISAIDAASGAVTATFFPTQGSSGGSIWGFGGASVDPSTNNVFIATGNADGTLQNAYYAEQIVELSPDLKTVIAHDGPPLPGSPDADFGATPLLFQPPGCPPLLAAVNKSGAFVLYNRNNIGAGPLQTILMSIATDEGDFIGVPAYDSITNYVYVGLPATFGTNPTYQHGAGAFSVRSDCTLNPTPVWNAVFGPDASVAGTGDDPRSAITIANGVLYVSGYSDNTTYAFDAATGARLWSAPLSGIGMVGPIVVNGRLYVGDQGGTVHAYSP